MHPKKTSDYIFTYSGEAIFPEEVRPEQIHLIDIAYGLAGILRYNGQTRISVLRHSIALMGAVGESSQEELFALLHDAAEAYMMDVPVPTKKFMKPEWATLYSTYEGMILEKYKCRPTDEEHASVMLKDKMLVEYEMDSRELYEPGNSIKYPSPRKLTDGQTDLLEELYQWDKTDDELIPIFLRYVRARVPRS